MASMSLRISSKRNGSSYFDISTFERNAFADSTVSRGPRAEPGLTAGGDGCYIEDGALILAQGGEVTGPEKPWSTRACRSP